MSHQKRWSVHAKIKQEYIAAGREVLVPWVGIHMWWKAEHGD